MRSHSTQHMSKPQMGSRFLETCRRADQGLNAISGKRAPRASNSPEGSRIWIDSQKKQLSDSICFLLVLLHVIGLAVHSFDTF